MQKMCLSGSHLIDSKVFTSIYIPSLCVTHLPFTQVKFKVVGRQNARVSSLMKDVLKKKKPRCEMQLFPMFLPIK